MRFISKLILIAVALIIGVLMLNYSTGIFGNTATSVSRENSTVGVYEVHFLQPMGTPLTFYQLPNGDYYTIVRLQTQTNTSQIPASFPVPVRSILISSKKDNQTGLYNQTYAVVIGKKWFEKIEKTGSIYLLATNSNYTFYSVSVSNTPGKYDKIVEEKLGISSSNGNLISVPDNTRTINLLSSLFYGAVITTPPVVANRTFDGVFYTVSTVPATTTASLRAYTTATLNTAGWSMDYYFGSTNSMTATMPAFGNLTVLITTPAVGKAVEIGDVNITLNSTEVEVQTPNSSFTLNVLPALLVFTPDGKIYSVISGVPVEVGTFNGYGSTVTLTVYQPGIIVGFLKKKPDEITPETVGKVFETVLDYEKGYANATVSHFKDRINAEYYSIFNPLGVVANGTVFIPTTVAVGKYYNAVTYDVHASPEAFYLLTTSREGLPLDYLNDYVVSENGFKVLNSTVTGVQPLKPTLAPAGSLRSLYFANVSTILDNLSWTLKSSWIEDTMTGYSKQNIYQGGIVGKYAVLTQFNTTTSAPVPVKWEWINRKVIYRDVFCCFVNIKIVANGISVTIDQNPANVTIKSDTGKFVSFKTYPYSVMIVHVSYDAGISCEFGIGFCEAGNNKCPKCPTFTTRGYLEKDLYKDPGANGTVIYREEIEKYQDQPCSNFDVRIGLMLILPGNRLSDFPNHRVYDPTGPLGVWYDPELKILAGDFNVFLNDFVKKDYAYYNWVIAGL